jgi:hypothetical protein
MKAEDFGVLETAKLLDGQFKTPHCSLRYRQDRFNTLNNWALILKSEKR